MAQPSDLLCGRMPNGVVEPVSKALPGAVLVINSPPAADSAANLGCFTRVLFIATVGEVPLEENIWTFR